MDNRHNKDYIRKRYRNANGEGLEKIPAKERPKLFEDSGEKRIAVYARVSTLTSQQTSSFELQQKYYSDFVNKQTGWDLVKIYSDEGISGTSINKINGFKQMIEDAKKGEFDLILVKSVSRFSRNVADGTTTINELKALNPPVGVYFENEGLYTLTNDTELPFNMFQMIAQEESRIKSVSMNASYEMRVLSRIFLTPPLLGYDQDEYGNLIVNPNEAKIVQLIFYMYLDGYSTEEIAETLTKHNCKTKKGNTNWTQGSITNVLHNERHCGTILTRKTWTPDYKTHKSRKNRGDLDQYLDHDHHTPIISRDDFNAVQKILANSMYGGKSFMPELYVESGGELDGYVVINPRWASFTSHDYKNASGNND
jgi:Site-specific recombinases, DNA invertase Pin homologs